MTRKLTVALTLMRMALALLDRDGEHRAGVRLDELIQELTEREAADRQP